VVLLRRYLFVSSEGHVEFLWKWLREHITILGFTHASNPLFSLSYKFPSRRGHSEKAESHPTSALSQKNQGHLDQNFIEGQEFSVKVAITIGCYQAESGS